MGDGDIRLQELTFTELREERLEEMRIASQQRNTFEGRPVAAVLAEVQVARRLKPSTSTVATLACTTPAASTTPSPEPRFDPRRHRKPRRRQQRQRRRALAGPRFQRKREGR